MPDPIDWEGVRHRLDAGESVVSIAADPDPAVPSESAIRRHLRLNPDFAPHRSGRKTPAKNVDWDRVLQRLDAGENARTICSDPDPSMPTPGHWAARQRSDPAFAARTKRVFDRRTADRRPLSVFDWDRARARIEAGARASEIWDDPDPSMPNRTHWKTYLRANPDYATGLRRIFKKRPKSQKYAEELWDLVIARISYGEQIKSILAEPGMPPMAAFWSRRQRMPAYDQRARDALIESGQKVIFDHAVWEDMLERVRQGASVKEVSALGGYPSIWQWIMRRRSDPDFDRRAGEAVSAVSRVGATFSESRREEILQTLAGGRLSDDEILADHTLPRPRTIMGWARQSTPFASRLREQWVAPRRRNIILATQHAPEAYERALAAMQEGHSIRALARLGLPSTTAIARWRRMNPAFDARIKAVSGVYRGLGQGRVVDGALMRRQLSQNELYAAVDGVISRGLEPHERDDVRSEMILAVLTGEIGEADITREMARSFVTAYHREAGTWRSHSLDAPTFGDSNRTMHDVLAG